MRANRKMKTNILEVKIEYQRMMKKARLMMLSRMIKKKTKNTNGKRIELALIWSTQVMNLFCF